MSNTTASYKYFYDYTTECKCPDIRGGKIAPPTMVSLPFQNLRKCVTNSLQYYDPLCKANGIVYNYNTNFVGKK